MHFVKLVDRGSDPRCRSYFIYRCGICDHEKDFLWVPNFDITRVRKCPKCGVEDDTNEVNYLIDKKAALEKEAEKKQAELVELNLQITEVTARLAQAQVAVKHETQTQPVRLLS